MKTESQKKLHISVKMKIALKITLNTFYVIFFLMTLLITANALAATLSKKQPSVFGYMVSILKSSSMAESGFEAGQYVITKKINDASALKIRSGGEPGDIITFYLHKDWRPVLNGEDRSDAMIIFHEIIGITDEGLFITKGSSNQNKDPYAVPFESISGVYHQTGKVVDLLIKMFLVGNRFLFLIIAVLIIIVLKQILAIFKIADDLRLQKEVISGKRRLFDKKCFERNIFRDFSQKQKYQLIDTSPCGMKILYEYLLCGRISQQSDGNIAEKLNGKRCTITDVLCLTYSGEKGSDVKADNYCAELPVRKTSFDKYRNTAEYQQEFAAEMASSLSLLFGCLLFTAIYFVIGFVSGYIASVWLAEAIVAVMLAPIALLYMGITVIEGRYTNKKLQEYLRALARLPARYHFIIQPQDYTTETIAYNEAEILRRMAPCLKPEKEVQFSDGEENISSVDLDIAEQNDNETPENNPVNWWSHLKGRPFETFEARLRKAPAIFKERYSTILNELLCYRKVRRRLSAKFDTIRFGRIPLLRIGLRGKSLLLFFNLAPKKLEAKYFIKDMSEYTAYQDFPAMLRVHSNRSFAYALNLIDKLTDLHELIPKPKYEPYDYSQDFYVNEDN